MTESEMVLADKTLETRFWAKVDRRGPDDCWKWTAGTSAGRYGCIKVGGKKGKDLKAHRIQAIWRGDDVHERVVMHTCDNGLCVNPHHLQVATQFDNVHDMLSKNRGNPAKGQRNFNSFLSDKFVLQIKRLLQKGSSASEISTEFELNYLLVYNIAARKTYTHVGADINYPSPSSKGERHHNAKLKEEDVAAMRRMYREKQSYNFVADAFGVNAVTAMRVIRGDRWPAMALGEPPIPERDGPIRQYGKRRLTDDQAKRIKELIRSGEKTSPEIASIFGVSKELVSAIKNGRSYAWIE